MIKEIIRENNIKLAVDSAIYRFFLCLLGACVSFLHADLQDGFAVVVLTVFFTFMFVIIAYLLTLDINRAFND
jgi:hypothetical protein